MVQSLANPFSDTDHKELRNEIEKEVLRTEKCKEDREITEFSPPSIVKGKFSSATNELQIL